MSSFKFQNVVTQASRELFLNNLQKVRVPMKKVPESKAAILVPFCTVEDDVSLLYTVRSSSLKNYGGQVSFPGGKVDNKETPIETALRETFEEIGLRNTRINIWGQGPGLPDRKNKHLVTPVIGVIKNLKPDEIQMNEEVSEVFTLPLKSLCNPKNQYHTQFSNGWVLPVYQVNECRVWGLTAYITHLVLSCLLPENVYCNEWEKKRISTPLQ